MLSSSSFLFLVPFSIISSVSLFIYHQLNIKHINSQNIVQVHQQILLTNVYLRLVLGTIWNIFSFPNIRLHHRFPFISLCCAQAYTLRINNRINAKVRYLVYNVLNQGTFVHSCKQIASTTNKIKFYSIFFDENFMTD